jgi:hypothetical protein
LLKIVSDNTTMSAGATCELRVPFGVYDVMNSIVVIRMTTNGNIANTDTVGYRRDISPIS